MYRSCTMAKSKQSKRRPVAIRVSERAHKLASVCDAEGNLGRAVEFALEVLFQMKAWELDAKALRIDGEVVRGDGPLSGEAKTRLTAHQALIVDRNMERFARAGIEAYRAERFFEGKAAE